MHNLDYFLKEFIELLKYEIPSDELDSVATVSDLPKDHSDFLVENLPTSDSDILPDPLNMVPDHIFWDTFFAAQDDLDSSLYPKYKWCDAVTKV